MSSVYVVTRLPNNTFMGCFDNLEAARKSIEYSYNRTIATFDHTSTGTRVKLPNSHIDYRLIAVPVYSVIVHL